MPQNRGGIGIGIATRVTVKPELVVLPYLRVTTEAVKHRCPGCRRVHEPMDYQHDDFVRVVGLEPRDTSRLRVLGRVEHARESELLGVGAREHQGEWPGEIRGKRKELPAPRDGFLR